MNCSDLSAGKIWGKGNSSKVKWFDRIYSSLILQITQLNPFIEICYLGGGCQESAGIKVA